MDDKDKFLKIGFYNTKAAYGPLFIVFLSEISEVLHYLQDFVVILSLQELRETGCHSDSVKM